MFSKKIVFVVGAGASHEFGMPLGSQLVGDVKAILDYRGESGDRPIGTGKPEVLDALRKIAKSQGNDINEYMRQCEFLREAIDLFPSVDNFLHSHSSNKILVDVGRIGIVSAIINSEKESNLYFDKSTGSKFNLSQVKGTWIEKFFTIACTDVTVENVSSIFSNVTIICFNYDRCIEHALFEMLKISYGIDDEAAAHCMSNLSIAHPYGTVGNLQWQDQTRFVPFGLVPSHNLDEISKNVRLFTENIADKEFAEFVDRHTSEMEMIAFIGFAYYKQNMELICRRKGTETRVLGTAFNISQPNIDKIKSDVYDRMNCGNGSNSIPSIVIQQLKTRELFDQYERALADI